MSGSGFARLWYVSLAAALLVGQLLIGGAASAQTLGPTKFTIERAWNAFLGDTVTVPVLYDNDSTGFEVAGVYLAIRYDTLALTLVDVGQGPLIDECGWNHFSSAVPEPGLMHIIATAYRGSGSPPPSCFFGDAQDDTVALLTFAVTSDSAYQCYGAGVQFYWEKCSDNSLSDESGLELLLSDVVVDPGGYWYPGTDTFPTYEGAPDSCADAPLDNAYRVIDFESSYVDIHCYDEIDDRGDINLNGIANEIADWVVFENFFFLGLEVFDVAPQQQIEASDVNADGQPLTVRDFGYLWRIIIGDALPYPKASEAVEVDTAVFVQDEDAQQVSLEFADSLVQIFMVFSGEILPLSVDSTISIDFLQLGGQTRLMLGVMSQPYPPEHQGIFSGPLFTYTGDGELITVEVADWHDNIVPTRIEVSGGATGCGDADGNTVANITDVVFLVQYIFADGVAPNPLTAGDANCDGIVNIADAVYLLEYVFAAGPSPCEGCQ